MAMVVRKICAGLLTLALSCPSIAQTPATALAPKRTPSEIVQAQVDAYNRRDLEGFLAFYADDAQILFYPNELALSGKEAMRERYRRTFEPPQLHATIPQRLAFDRFVIDQESVVTGRPDRPLIEAVAIYEIKDDRIVRVTFLRH
jgi:hypothetical protein